VCFGKDFDVEKHLTYFTVYECGGEGVNGHNCIALNDVLKKFDIKELTIIYAWV
jgi:hypothetical protein